MIILADLPHGFVVPAAYLHPFDGAVVPVRQQITLPAISWGLLVLDASRRAVRHAALEVLVSRTKVDAVIVGVGHKMRPRLVRRLPPRWYASPEQSPSVREMPLWDPHVAAYRLPRTYHHETDHALWRQAFGRGVPILLPVDARAPERALVTLHALRRLEIG